MGTAESLFDPFLISVRTRSPGKTFTAALAGARRMNRPSAPIVPASARTYALSAGFGDYYRENYSRALRPFAQVVVHRAVAWQHQHAVGPQPVLDELHQHVLL